MALEKNTKPLISLTSWRIVCVVAAASRLGILVYGEWQDRNMKVKFTDVDYRVFTDAAGHVLEGRSPYGRATYRYTPLLAFLMTLNVLVHDCIGKIIFSALDLAVGTLIHSIVLCRGHRQHVAVLCACSWLFNPLTMTISTRGNAESLLAVVVLICIWLLYQKRIILAGTCLGLAIHCKFFPIIYSLPMFLFIDEQFGARILVPSWSSKNGLLAAVSRFLRPQRILFALATVLSFFLLSAWMYYW